MSGSAANLRAVVTIVNQKGLHARAAAMFAKTAEAYDADITVSAHGHTVPGGSIMGLLMLGAARGAEIEISTTGPAAADALAALTRLVGNGFEEEDFPGY